MSEQNESSTLFPSRTLKNHHARPILLPHLPSNQNISLQTHSILNHSVPFRFILQTALITYWAQEAEEKRFTTPIDLIINYARINGANGNVGKSYRKACTSWPLFVSFLYCSFSSSKSLMHEMWLDGGDGGEKCRSHQWDLYGVLKWAHSVSECSAACVFSPSIDRKLHPRLPVRSIHCWLRPPEANWFY